MTESFEDAIKALRHMSRGNGAVMRIADRIVAAHERETKVEGVCGPITGELRAAMRQWGWVESDGSITFATSPTPPSIDAEQSLAISGTDFTQLCDAIDSVHAQLERENDELRMKFVNANRHALHVERENESLKAELDRVLGEQEDRSGCIYYDPERHYCSCHDIDTDGLVELPKDADGVPIRVGDTVEYVDDTLAPRNVTSINLAGDGWWVYINGLGRRPDVYRHVTPDTWERIIEDAIGEGMARQRNNDSGNFCERANPMNNGDLVARCKKLAGDAE